jgi:ribosome-associated protein
VAKRAGRAPGRSQTSLARALRAAEVAESRGAENVVVLDLRDQTLVTDYFVLATGTSRVQIRALIDAIADGLADVRPRAREGDEAAGWVLLDYGDVVVHVFSPEARAFYRLERLWGDAPAVER